MPDGESIEAALKQRGLERVLEPARFAGGVTLSHLMADLSTIDFATLDRQLATLQTEPELSRGEISPPKIMPSSTSEEEGVAEATASGLEALRSGRVALATVAGGQASRLGFDGPKGTYPLGPVSGASLFQIFAGQVQRLREITGAALPWIIQTGPENHHATQEFFVRRNHFGLAKGSVFFVCQGTLPALNSDGQLLLSNPSSLFRNPDGHGGFYRALKSAGIFPILKSIGVDLVYYCQIDNPLVRMGDPAFLGFHLDSQAQMSVKVVEKVDPDEKVGLIVNQGDTVTCLEYSDLPDGFAEQRAADKGLLFRAGNIATHAFDLNFLEEMAEAHLPLHVAKKSVLSWDANVFLTIPQAGIKFETFVFDALPLAHQVMVQLCDRHEEFAPVKNRSGTDSVNSARLAWDKRTRDWLAALNGPKPADGLTEIAAGHVYDLADLLDQRPAVKLSCGNRYLVTR